MAKYIIEKSSKALCQARAYIRIERTYTLNALARCTVF